MDREHCPRSGRAIRLFFTRLSSPTPFSLRFPLPLARGQPLFLRKALCIQFSCPRLALVFPFTASSITAAPLFRTRAGAVRMLCSCYCDPHDSSLPAPARLRILCPVTDPITVFGPVFFSDFPPLRSLLLSPTQGRSQLLLSFSVEWPDIPMSQRAGRPILRFLEIFGLLVRTRS